MSAGRRRCRPTARWMPLAALVMVAGGCGSGSGAGGTYEVAAIFDNASFLTQGVDVRIAGARVGQVSGLSVTRQHKARVVLEIDRRFAPFHEDADCTIQPQSLISERFVNCTPGTSAARPVTAPPGGGLPVLGVTGTHSPVDIDQVLNTFQLPVRERLTLLFDSLGVGLAARGEDLNAAIRRAAPALQATHDTLAILGSDRARLQRLIANSDTVLQSLAAGRGRIAQFVRQAGVVAATSGVRRRRLAAAVRDLPPLLAQARPSLDHLTAFAKVGTPFAQDLRASGPGLRRLVTQLAPFSAQATPTIVRLGATARRATAALPDIAPQVRRLRRFAAPARPAGKLVATLFSSFRANGTIEAVQGFLYYAAAAVARFDKHSHYLPAYLLGDSPCARYATTPTAGCDAHFEATRKATTRAAARGAAAPPRPSARRGRPAGRGPGPPSGASTPPAPRPPLPQTPALPPLPKAVQDLLGVLGGRPGGRAPGVAPGPPEGGGAAGLLGYLLG